MSGVTYYGDYPLDYAGDVIMPFNTFGSTPAASVTITDLVDADIKVHKDGSTSALVTDDATIAIDFSTVTGNHVVTIDISTNGNYTAGSEYMVRIEGTTVDAGTVNAWIGSFSIERTGGVLALIKAGNLSANVAQWNGAAVATPDAAGYPVITVKDGTGQGEIALTAGAVDTVSTLTGHTVQTGDTYALANGATGFVAIDTVVDSILVDTGTDIPARFDGIEGATFTTGTDSLEALRDRGDAAWTTGAGGTPPQLLQSTTIATLASQTSFTLTAGSADDDAYIGCLAIVTDQATSTQKCIGTVSDYTGSTKTVTLKSDPGVFTMIATDNIDILAALPEIQTDWLTADGIAPDFTNEITAGLATTEALVDALIDETLTSHVTADSVGVAIKDTLALAGDVTKINGSATAAVNLALSTGKIFVGECTGTPTTTVIPTDLSNGLNILNGALILFTGGAADGERAPIQSLAANGDVTLALADALENAPAATDPFIVI